ncbi:MotA/TolQ/ExbB proton channel family protein [Paraburkholderia sediminicola]|uniref:MotA/TolQ/ExbB proton channel family protein n=1 Tax=Paraburkholderia sediminicola TaxID=458836 RepID=UPI0038B92D39
MVRKYFASVIVAGLISIAINAGAETSDVAATTAASSPVSITASADTPNTAPPVAVAEPTSNPYGLDALWKGGDMVARGTLVILVIMSMGSWYIMITKVLEQSKMARRARATQRQVWSTTSLRVGVDSLENGSPFRFIAESGIDAEDHHEGVLLENVDLNTWIGVEIERAVSKVSSRMQDGLSFLGTVGSTAPFVGLFGTVWGIYHALTAIGIAGQASIDKVAGPVGEALIMTAIGLAVAVPAVLGYNWLVRRNKAVMEDVRGFAAELHTVLLGGKAPKGRTSSDKRVMKVAPGA